MKSTTATEFSFSKKMCTPLFCPKQALLQRHAEKKNTEDADMAELILASPDFEPEDWIPDRNSAYGGNFSPEFVLEGIDEKAVSVVITLDDLGHPIQPGYNHWVAWNIAPARVLPGHLPKGAVIEQPIHAEQGLAYGKHCYRGPRPPFHWNHRYRFTVYMLDSMLSVSTDSDKAAVLKAMEGHILQKACLYGKYQRNHD
jgi:Raf kinase inhibitor-like YbhB/YbcL family protein